MRTVTVLLVDDHELFLNAVRAALESADDVDAVRFEVVGTATDGSVVPGLVSRLRPDVVVLDVGMPGLDGLACLQILRDRFPATRVVMLSALSDATYVRAAFARGASAYIMKTIDSVDFVSALRQVIEETVYVALKEPERPAAVGGVRLSERETEILRYAARGLPNAAIAKELFVTAQTVKFHLTNVYRKLGVNNRTEAAREAHRRGLAVHPAIDPPPLAPPPPRPT